MNTEIVLTGGVALILWIFIWLCASYRSPLGWASPTSLFAVGLLSFYIVPSLYWQFRPWNYVIPSCFEGLPLVLEGAIVLGLPFVIYSVAELGQKKVNKRIFQPRNEIYNKQLWIMLFPISIGVAWRMYLVTIGWQGRLARDNPSLLGSESLALIINNFWYYYAACYFALVAVGNKSQRRAGIVLWALDGLFQIYLLHRYWILLFVFRSAVFMTLLRWKLKLRHWVIASIFGILVLSIIGQSHIFSNKLVYGDKRYLTAGEVLEVLHRTGVGYVEGVLQDRGNASTEENMLLRLLDDTMFRLYDARSASAVMMNVPDVIHYFYGETFLHMFYSLIPRYLWTEKPQLSDIHRVTIQVMPNDSGVNPAGTIAEFYMNYGFFAVLFGGIVSFILCQWSDHILTRRVGAGPTWLCMYPLLAEQFIAANNNFTQRISESIHWGLVLLLIAILLQFAKKQIVIIKGLNTKHSHALTKLVSEVEKTNQ